MTDPYINRILKKTITKDDLVYIANNFTEICESIKDVNDVFMLMKEEHLNYIIKNILYKKYGLYPKKHKYAAYKKAKQSNQFNTYCPIYFQRFDVNTFCNNINKIKLPKKSADLFRILDFVQFLKYDIVNNYVITTNNTILDNYMLYYTKSINIDTVIHYMILNKDRFLKAGYKGNSHNKNLITASCFKKDYINTECYEIIYIDLYEKKIGEISLENASKIINIAIEKNYYDIFMDCYNIGVTLNETHYSKHLVSFVKKFKQYLLKEPYKILEHFCKIEKCQITMDLQMSNQLQLALPNILHLVTNITFENVKNYYENNYLDISKYNYTEDQLNILYNILFVKYVLYKRAHITSFVKDTNIKQYIYREMFKKSTMSQIAKYEKLYKLTIDQWCINNAFLANNKKIITSLIEKEQYPSSSVSLLLFERTSNPMIKQYLQKYIEKSCFIKN